MNHLPIKYGNLDEREKLDHELKGSLGVLRMLTKRLLDEDDLMQSLKLIELIVSLLERYAIAVSKNTLSVQDRPISSDTEYET